MKKLCALALSIAALAPHAVYAQQCADITRYGVFENFESAASSFDSSQVANWACSASTRNADGAFNYGKTKLTFGSSGSNNSCSSNSSSFVLSKEAKESIRKASREIVDAWRDCINANAFGSIAYIVHRPDARFFSIELKHRDPNMPKTIAKLSAVGSFQCDQPANVLSNVGVEVQTGRTIQCTRSNVHEPLSISVNFSSGYPDGSLYLAALPSGGAQPIDIESALLGDYQVILGLHGGCNGGQAKSTPQKLAKIEKDKNGALVAINECENRSSVTILSQDDLIIWNMKVFLRIRNNDDVAWKDDAGNTWKKIRSRQ